MLVIETVGLLFELGLRLRLQGRTARDWSLGAGVAGEGLLPLRIRWGHFCIHFSPLCELQRAVAAKLFNLTSLSAALRVT